MAVTFHDRSSLLAAIEERSFDRPPAIVANAHITGLGVARALAAHDVPVIALDRTDGGLGWPSNAVDLAGKVTYPLDDFQGFHADIEAIVEAVGSAVVAFGCMDEWVQSYAALDLDGVHLPGASVDVVDRVLNKASLYEIARSLDVPIPETYSLETATPEEVLDQLEFPFVVKPERKRELEEAIGTNVVEVDSPATFDRIVSTAAESDIALLAQERVSTEPGEDRSFVSYVPPSGADDALSIVGNPVVRYPRAFGTSCVVDRITDPEIERRALAVLAEAGYHGISEAEFVFDRARGEHVLLDVNTRPWKWIGLPVAVGANLPVAAYANAIGIEQPSWNDRGSMRWIYLRDYLAAAMAESSAPTVVSRDEWRAIASGTFERDGAPVTTGVYRPTDPDPTAKLIADEATSREYYCAC